MVQGAFRLRADQRVLPGLGPLPDPAIEATRVAERRRHLRTPEVHGPSQP